MVHGRIGIGIVVRDHDGHVTMARSLMKMGNLEPVVTEALAAFHATLFCQELGLQNVIWKMMCSK